MKVTIVHTNNKKQLLVSTKTMEKLMERFARDDSKLTITHFRESIPYLSNNYEGYKDMPKWMHIYPAAEFAKDENNNLKMKAFNGILLLKFGNITDMDGVEGIKRSVAILPSTLAAITGADGKTVIVLIKFQGENDSLPTSETDAEHLYRIAYQQIFPVYQAIVKASILVDGPKPSIEAGSTLSQEPSIHNSFMMTLDAEPYFNSKAVAMKIDSHTRSQSPALSTDNNQQTIPDFRAPEEGKKVDKNSIRENIVNMMQLLKSRYDFRYNTVMKFVEYMPKEKGWYGFQPVDPRVQKRMTLEVQLADIRVSIKDVRNFLESDYIKNYNPIEEYLFQCYDKWDGKDHIRALARTVPTANPHWADWFYTWFLGMVDQWRGYSHRQYGNSVAPLLISKQGYNKSTFCRRLLPPELQWGYSDNLILSEKRQVYQAMAQFMVINLDEFNQISPQVQQGFLKNLLQLPTVKIKPPYGSHVQEFPRLASFIATSNMTDILSDPSGNRRFLGVELTGPIDVSGRLNYEQLYAQAMQALERGEKSYFNAKETAIIMQHNRQFEQFSPIKQCFLQVFEPASTPENGEYLMAAAIFDILKQKFGSSLQVSSIQKLGRELQNIEGLKNRRTRFGTEYLVVRK